MKDRGKGFQKRSSAFAVEHKVWKIGVPSLVGKGQELTEESYNVEYKIIFERMNHNEIIDCKMGRSKRREESSCFSWNH